MPRRFRRHPRRRAGILRHYRTRAEVVVVPNTLATNDGDTSFTAPEGSAVLRLMQIFDASQFGALSGPSFLTQLARRPDTNPGGLGPRTFTLRIYASTTSRSVAGLSTTFAENLGTNNTLVFDGTVTATTGICCWTFNSPRTAHQSDWIR